MDIRNRMHDVIKLRCNACQDFLKLIIHDGWQQLVYDKAKNEVTKRGRFRDKYISVYYKMREKGVDSYKVEDMDVTFISEVIHGCKSIAPTNDKTKEAIEKLTEDRNITDHSNENEDKEELYLRVLLDLCDLEKFVRTVDRYETKIEDEVRLGYVRKYITEIEKLKDILDKERIILIQRTKDVERDIKRVLESEDRVKEWCTLFEIYLKHYWIVEEERYHEFMVRASDAGIVGAHLNAADYFFVVMKDYVEGEKRLIMLYDSYDKLPAGEAKGILDLINHFLRQGNVLTDGMIKIVNGIIEQGNPISVTDDGLYVWRKNR